MLLLIVWDGLRPDMLTPERTPFVCRMAQQGTFCRASHAVFPTATRINAASLSTGCYPGQHGLVDNELYIPALNPQQATSCADWRALQAMADQEGGRLLGAPTLGELLRAAGKRLAVGCSGSPGTTYLNDPTLTGPVVNMDVAWPAATQAMLQARYGGMLTPQSSTSERNRFVLRALRELVIPQTRPDVVTLWFTEPDHQQHYHGLASPEALALLRELDADLEEFTTHLARAYPNADLTCFLFSDHGFTSVLPGVEPREALSAAGFTASTTSSDIVRASNSLYLRDAARARLGEIVAWLQGQAWIGGVLVRDDLLSECPSAMPQSAVMGGHRRSAEIMYSFRGTQDVNAFGVPGSVVHPSSMQGLHGSASPYDVHNTLLAWGAGIKAGVISELPCGIVDVAPTVLHLLGSTPPQGMAGRVLHELLADGDTLNQSVTRSRREVLLSTPRGERRQTAHYATVVGHTYLDQVTLENA